jgi:thioredoxin reductase
MTELAPVDVAIVGAGPAGLAAAVALRRCGVARVVILEREEEAGGIPRHCGHSPFGLREFGRIMTGPAYARRLVASALAAGAELRTRTTVLALGADGRLELATEAGTSTMAARRIILATGARETPRSARLVGGERPQGVLNTGALQAFVHLQRLLPFRRPVIVGTELVSLSAVLTCLAAGARPAAVIEPGDRPTARRPLNLFPRLCGIPMLYGTDVVDIRGKARVGAVTVRRRDGTLSEIACDGVLFTGRFVPEASLVRASPLAVDAGSGGPAIDQWGRCSDPTCFAAGNLLRPVETAGWCHREGGAIGRSVADDLSRGLPPPAPALAVRRGDGIKLAVPQRIVPGDGEGGLTAIQLRVAEAIAGTLTATAGGATLWLRGRSALPERRLLIPLASIRPPDGAGELVIGFR